MNKERLAERLLTIAEALVAKKGEVPEAFKKQWKKDDNKGDGDDKEDKKPDFLKKKDKKSAIAGELLAVAKELTAKAEIDFQDIADQIDSLIDEVDTHINSYQRDYDRPVASQIDRGTRFLIEAKKTFKDIEAYDEDPLG